MRRACALVAVLALTAASAHAQEAGGDAAQVVAMPGESAATALQRTIVERWARLSALRARYGEGHPEVVREREQLRVLVDGARDLRGGRARIDRAGLAEWIRQEILDVDARLGELSVSCHSGHPDVRTGQARREALVLALGAIERRGVFLPNPLR